MVAAEAGGLLSLFDILAGDLIELHLDLWDSNARIGISSRGVEIRNIYPKYVQKSIQQAEDIHGKADPRPESKDEHRRNKLAETRTGREERVN